MILTGVDGSMNESDKPLAFLQSSYQLWLNPLDGTKLYVDDCAEPDQFDTMNYKHFGRPFMREGLPKLEWGARTDAESISDIAELHCFHGGLLISSRIRAIIEAYDSTNLEFIPLKVRQNSTGELLADDWWYCNVYNWKDAYDFEKSDVDWVVFPEMPDSSQGPLRLARQFGDKAITIMRNLVILPEALEGGLYVARAPTTEICSRVFVGHELGRELVVGVNETAPTESRIHLEVFDPAAPRRMVPFPRMDLTPAEQKPASPVKDFLSRLFKPK